MIDTIIFDIGNVLTVFDWKGFIEQYHFAQEVNTRLADITIHDPLWNEFDRGVWTNDEVVDAFVQKAPDLEQELRSMFVSFHGIVKRADYAIPWIKELKNRDYKVLVLSNFPDYAHRQCMDALDFLPYTDGGILSYQEKVIKPDPAIYQLIIDRYKLIPENCVFIDDLNRNLLPAAELGIHTILFGNYEQANRELEEKLNGSI